MDPLGAKSIIHAVQDARHSHYLISREAASRALNRNRQWNSNTYRLASKVWQLPTVSIARRAKILRIVWDKHYHGDNRSKDTSLTPAQRQFVQHCSYCYSTNDTQDHWIRLCTAQAYQQYGPNSRLIYRSMPKANTHASGPQWSISSPKLLIP